MDIIPSRSIPSLSETEQKQEKLLIDYNYDNLGNRDSVEQTFSWKGKQMSNIFGQNKISIDSIIHSRESENHSSSFSRKMSDMECWIRVFRGDRVLKILTC